VIALLDVNVLIALFDPAHVHHEAAHVWFEANRESRWSTCTLTENAFVRVLSNPAYPGRGTTVENAVSRLRSFCSAQEHVFWPDSVSLVDVISSIRRGPSFGNTWPPVGWKGCGSGRNPFDHRSRSRISSGLIGGELLPRHARWQLDAHTFLQRFSVFHREALGGVIAQVVALLEQRLMFAFDGRLGRDIRAILAANGWSMATG
jgi:toxin-antitoxin system PIN domain toxin